MNEQMSIHSFQVHAVVSVSSGILAAFTAVQGVLDPDTTYVSLTAVIGLCSTCVYATYRVMKFISAVETKLEDIKEKHDGETG